MPLAEPVTSTEYVPAGVSITVCFGWPVFVEGLPPQPARNDTVSTTESKEIHVPIRILRRRLQGRMSTQPSANAVSAPNRKPRPGPVLRVAVAAGAEALMVSVADAVVLNAGEEGLTLHVNWLDDGAQVRASVPLKLFTEVKFSAMVPLLPLGTVICGTAGTTMKPPTVWLTVRLTLLLVEPA